GEDRALMIALVRAGARDEVGLDAVFEGLRRVGDGIEPCVAVRLDEPVAAFAVEDGALRSLALVGRGRRRRCVFGGVSGLDLGVGINPRGTSARGGWRILRARVCAQSDQDPKGPNRPIFHRLSASNEVPPRALITRIFFVPKQSSWANSEDGVHAQKMSPVARTHAANADAGLALMSDGSRFRSITARPSVRRW